VVRLGGELGGGDSTPGGLGSSVQASVPNGDDQAGVADCQRAGQMNCAGSAQSVGSGEVAGVLFNLGGEVYRAGGRPEDLTVALGFGELGFGEVVIAGCRSECGDDDLRD
jgi:hypothetical protein